MNKKDIIKLARQAIIDLVPYSSARSEFKGKADILLDANENAYGSAIDLPYVTKALNRYPDPQQFELKTKVARLKGIKSEQVFIGNGSDEAIDLLIRVFCEPKKDSILITPPTYGMYKVIADIQGVKVEEAPLDKEYRLVLESIQKKLHKSKILFICSPNNPTGNAFDLKEIEILLKASNAIVVVDEAYVDFSGKGSAISLLKKYKNLVVLQTLSKAWGLAGARIGFAFSHPELLQLLSKIKFPYNLSVLAQSAGLEALDNIDFLTNSVSHLVEERERVAEYLMFSDKVERVFPSDANFLLVKFKDSKQVFEKLIINGIITRDRSAARFSEGCIRITIGTREENDLLLGVLGIKLDGVLDLDSREATLRRKTKETDIKVSLSSKDKTIKVDTGIGFLDHMLILFATHSGLGIKLVCRGDLQVDEHHSVEDCAISVGLALRKFLGDCKGISRYGFYLPMDEAWSQIALDISGRSFLVWNVKLNQVRVGDISSSLFEHFFRSFCEASKITLHIKAEGQDDHHIIEAVFKGVARALRMAVSHDASAEIPSSKGSL
jgi:histidinol-phosphate aminotransferase